MSLNYKTTLIIVAVFREDYKPPQAPTHWKPLINLAARFKKTNHNLTKNTQIAGRYKGYIIIYDWSGKHVISQSKLQLNLKQENEYLAGQWKEKGQDPVHLNAKITDTAILFTNTEQTQKDHYHRDKKLLLQFKKGYFNMVQSADTIYLSGHLETYSPRAKEPEKPRVIMLVRTNTKSN